MELRDKGKYGFLLPPELIIPVGENSIQGADDKLGQFLNQGI
jgi:hypothetical protein